MNDPHATDSELELVTFDRPPLSEVGLSVQFAPGAVDIDVLAAFTAATRAALPRRQHHVPVPPMVETFDDAPRPAPFSIQVQGQLTLPRTWFMSDDQVSLVQLQPDRLSFNWRRIDGAADYPRYPEIRERLVEYLGILYRCFEEVGSVQPTVNLCEVAYINPIELPDAPERWHPDLSRILKRVRPEALQFLPAPEDSQLQERYRIAGDDGPIGRLHLSATPVVAGTPPHPLYMVNLAARVRPRGAELEPVCEALDIGHRWVVLGFTDVTTDEMHKLWGLDDGGETQ